MTYANLGDGVKVFAAYEVGDPGDFITHILLIETDGEQMLVFRNDENSDLVDVDQFLAMTDHMRTRLAEARGTGPDADELLRIQAHGEEFDV